MRAATASAAARASASATLTIAVIPKGTSHVFWQSIHAGAEQRRQGARRRRSSGAGRCARTIATRRSRKSKASSAAASPASCSRRSTRPRWSAPVARRDATQDPGRDLRLRAEGQRLRQLRRDRQPARAASSAASAWPRRSDGKGKVVLLRYAEGHDSTGKREEGFLDAMKAHPGIEVVSSNQYGGADVEGAYKKRGVAAQPLQEAGRQPRHRRHLLRRTNRRRSRCCACCRTTAGRARCSSSASTRPTTW